MSTEFPSKKFNFYGTKRIFMTGRIFKHCGRVCSALFFFQLYFPFLLASEVEVGEKGERGEVPTSHPIHSAATKSKSRFFQ
jgi:hypothetical protein